MRTPWLALQGAQDRRAEVFNPATGAVQARVALASQKTVDEAVASALKALVPWDRQRDLDRLVPTHIEVPSGSRVAIDYTNPAEPTLSVRLQEMFGLSDTPRIAGGKVPLTVHLLSPARRPVQVTQDLANFWRSTYAEVKKDLKGRYPKHYWPDDPLIAEPTARAKPRK